MFSFFFMILQKKYSTLFHKETDDKMEKNMLKRNLHFEWNFLYSDEVMHGWSKAKEREETSSEDLAVSRATQLDLEHEHECIIKCYSCF